MARTSTLSPSTRSAAFALSLLLNTLLFAACGDEGSGGGGTDAAVAELTPSEEFLPKVTGTCPGFAEGDGCELDETSLICTFQPENVVKPRKVRVWFSDATEDKDGPVVVYWHGLSSQAAHVLLPNAGLGQEIVDEVVEQGGVVIAPEIEEGRVTSLLELPWFLAAQGKGPEDDLLVMDEAIACATEKFGADVRRLYSTGMSAGGLQTGQVIMRRSGYIASAAVYSGGMAGLPPLQDPDNKLPVAIFYGGPSDMVAGVDFEPNAKDMRVRLGKNKQFNILCNHDLGHVLPADAARAGWEFLQAHPYGVAPEPYADELPSSFPDYCEL